MIRRKRGIGLKWDIRQDRSDEEPRSEPGTDEHGVLGYPPQSSPLSQLPLRDWTGVNISACLLCAVLAEKFCQ